MVLSFSGSLSCRLLLLFFLPRKGSAELNFRLRRDRVLFILCFHVSMSESFSFEWRPKKREKTMRTNVGDSRFGDGNRMMKNEECATHSRADWMPDLVLHTSTKASKQSPHGMRLGYLGAEVAN